MGLAGRAEIPIKDLPLYSPDFDADYPAGVRLIMHIRTGGSG
jgi:hypothetical protein